MLSWLRVLDTNSSLDVESEGHGALRERLHPTACDPGVRELIPHAADGMTWNNSLEQRSCSWNAAEGRERLGTLNSHQVHSLCSKQAGHPRVCADRPERSRAAWLNPDLAKLPLIPLKMTLSLAQLAGAGS